MDDPLDLPALTTWLRGRGCKVASPLSAFQIVGGRSNLTYFLTAADGIRWVLRRPPLGHLMATAHDVAREVKVLQALAEVLPVPTVVGLDADSAGTPFYVMPEVPGHVVRSAADATELAIEARQQCGRSLMAGLAALHAVDPAKVGLADFGRGSEYLQRQVALWQRMGDQYRTAPFPEADAVRERIRALAPKQERISLVHGDYRLDNVLIAPDGSLNAILDWELCTRGNPYVDLAVSLYYWTERSDLIHPFANPPTVLPGFLSRDDLLTAYVDAGGSPLPNQDYYFAYAAWRLALVFEGVLGRFASGAYGGSDLEEEQRLAQVVKQLVSHADDLLNRFEAGFRDSD